MIDFHDEKKILKATDCMLTLLNKNITEDEAKKNIDLLRDLLRGHNYFYYSLAKPLISDSDFDALFLMLVRREDQFPELIVENSPSKLIGFEPLDGFTKREHKISLLSLQNTYNADDIRERAEFLERNLSKETNLSRSYCVEPKLDGSSVEIIYEYGALSGGITRGDGQIGEDISSHILHIANLPLTIAARRTIPSVHLRGEIVMPESAFDQVNIYQSKSGKSVFANARNAAAGTLRQLDPRLVASRGLVCYIYDLLFIDYGSGGDDGGGLASQSHFLLLNELSNLGIPVYPWRKEVFSIDDLVEVCGDKTIQLETQKENVACDGLVIKINEPTIRDLLGITQHHPRRAIAYKYPSQEAAAKLESIDLQVGRTGVITPLARIDPISLGGVIISNATLHNFDFISDRDIRVGDWIWIKRSGEVIPYVIGPILERRERGVDSYCIPIQCPSCNSFLERKAGEVALICINTTCKAKIIAKLQHFVSKQCMNIPGLGEAMIALLVEADLIASGSDLYNLGELGVKQKLLSLPGIGTIKLEKILQEIQGSLGYPLWRLLHALGIPGVGKKNAQILSDYFIKQFPDGINSYDELVAGVSQQSLEGLYGIGNRIAEDFLEYIRTDLGKNEISFFIEKGFFTFIHSEENTPIQSPFTGKTIVITGNFSISRDVLSNNLEQLGAVITNSISKKTDYLFVGEKPGSKFEKAQSLGVSVITESLLLSDYSDWIDYLFTANGSGGDSKINSSNESRGVEQSTTNDGNYSTKYSMESLF